MTKIICRICSNVFNGNNFSKVCSLKCRIHDGIIKDDNGCWMWIKGQSGDYGKIIWKGKTSTAHRASYRAFKGEIPEGLNVCHKCDKPLCVNPDHLWLGTQKENRQDAVNKNRTPKGTKNHFHKFTDKQVEEMIKLKKEGFSYSRLTRIFNCSTVYLWLITTRKLR